MNKLRQYLNSLPVPEQADFARRCGTTIGYLRKAISAGQQLAEKTCIAIDRESRGVVRCEDIRADVDWGYLRGTSAVPCEEPHSRSKPRPLSESGLGAMRGCQTADRELTGGPVAIAGQQTTSSESQGACHG